MSPTRRDKRRSRSSRKNRGHGRNGRTTTEAEGRANDEEQECRAEADAFERLRNEYNKTVEELEDLEKSKSRISRGEQEKLTRSQWPKATETSKWKGVSCAWCLHRKWRWKTRSLCRMHLGIVIQPTQWSSTMSNRFLCTSTWLLIDCVSTMARLSADGLHSGVEDNALFSLRCHVVRGREVTRVLQNVG